MLSIELIAAAALALSSVLVASVVWARHMRTEQRVRELQDHVQRQKTELDAAEAALRDGQETLRAYLESAAQGIVAVNPQGTIELVNRRAEQMFGYSRDELIGRRVELLVPERLQDQHACDRAGYFGNPRARPMGLGLDLSASRKDGTEFPVEISLTHIEVGANRMALSFISDITERKRLEEQLVQAQKMEAVGQLAGGVAHDFNNLLTIISGYTALLANGLAPDDPSHESLREIGDASERASALTRQLLAFSRQQVIQPRIVRLDSIVANIEKMLRRLIGEDVELLIGSDPSLAKIKADPGQMEQIILNVALNARDAMPNGGKLLIETANVHLDREYAQAHFDTPAGDYVMLAMTDTGSGMTHEVQLRIFEPFFTTKEVGKGSGLGLSIVYGIVKQSGGHIWVYSEPARGTTFKIYFPAVEPTSEYLETAPAHTSISGDGTETILLVEDEGAVRRFVRSLLEKSGYEVLEAANGEEALQLMEGFGGKVDLVLTDVIMPKMNGRDMVQRIKATVANVKVLYMSGYTDRGISLDPFIEPNEGFIQKPFTVTALARRVRELLNQK